MKLKTITYIICLTAVLTCCRKHHDPIQEPQGKPDTEKPDTNDSIPELPDSPGTFSITPDNLQSDYIGGTFRISVECDGDWILSGMENWTSSDISAGTGSSSINLTISSNGIPKERICTLTVRNEERELPIIVFQKAMPQLEVEKSAVSTDGDGEVFDIFYTNNYDMEISSSESWINITSHSVSLKRITFEVKRNTDDKPRSGEIRLQLTDFPEFLKTITITQGAKIPHPRITFEEGASITRNTAERFSLHPLLEDMTDSTLIWSSNNSEVATIDNNGNVTINSSGECTITVKNRYHNIEASIKLIAMLKAESLKIYFGEQEMETNPIAVRYIGEEFVISTQMTPEDAYKEDITFMSSSPEIAKIDNRRVSCLKAGRTTIHIESAYHGFRYSYTLIVKE